MRLVVIESPFRSLESSRINRIIMEIRYRKYLDAAIEDCINRGESPIASHRMLTNVLDDKDPDGRALGIRLGFAWRDRADATVVYRDFGISEGMAAGIADAERKGVRVEYRRIPGWG